jgi:hypothetical protein
MRERVKVSVILDCRREEKRKPDVKKCADVDRFSSGGNFCRRRKTSGPTVLFRILMGVAEGTLRWRGCRRENCGRSGNHGGQGYEGDEGGKRGWRKIGV